MALLYNSISNSEEIYSLEEIKIGVWIDGKPLYKRTLVGLVGPSKANDEVHYTFEDLNIDTLISHESIAHRTNRKGYVSLPYRTSDANGSAWIMILLTISEPNTVILGGYASSISQSSSWWSCKINITLYYTKTTDVVNTDAINLYSNSLNSIKYIKENVNYIDNDMISDEI